MVYNKTFSQEDIEMLYKETEKKEIERVYAVFADYIRENPYLEWFWSDKLGYLLLKIKTKKWQKLFLECLPEYYSA